MRLSIVAIALVGAIIVTVLLIVLLPLFGQTPTETPAELINAEQPFEGKIP